MKLKSVSQWTESAGVLSPPPWINGDWHSVMSLLARLLSDNLVQRKKSEDMADVTFKIAFDSMMQLGQDVAGIPQLVTEADLSASEPSLNLAILTAIVCIKSSVDVEPKVLKKAVAPKLVFEARSEHSTTNCAVCAQHVFIIERIVVNQVIYHRKCLRCTRCEQTLRAGLFRQTKGGFECIEHWPRAVLSKEKLLTSQHPKEKPPPPPKPKNLIPTPSPSPLPQIVYDRTPEPPPGGVLEDNKYQGSSPPQHLDLEDLVEETVLETVETKVLSEHGEDRNQGVTHVNQVKMRPQLTISCEDGVNIQANSAAVDVDSVPDDPSSTPVAPPRPKRRSMLLGIKTPSSPSLANSSSPSRRNSSLSHGHSSLSHGNSSISRRGNGGSVKSSRSVSPSQTKAISSIVDYPGFLNPFGSDEEECAEGSDSYDECLNPFESESEQDESNQVTNAMSTLSTNNPPCPSPRSGILPGMSCDRPKSQPPPPPKPPRPLLDAINSNLLNLPRSRTNLLPNVPTRRKIMFTENGNDDIALLPMQEIVEMVDKEWDSIELSGTCIEKELLFNIEQNGSDWVKNRRVDEWIEVVERRCALERRQSAYIMKWLEKFLNEIHSDTEFQLRCLIESVAEKTPFDVEREAKLLELLVEIINEKSRMIESRIDSDAVIGSCGAAAAQTAKDETSKKRIKTRLKKLRKKVKKYHAKEKQT